MEDYRYLPVRTQIVIAIGLRLTRATRAGVREGNERMFDKLTTLKQTKTEQAIMRAISTKPDEWLNCHGSYLPEALALQAKGLITTRMQGEQLQVRCS